MDRMGEALTVGGKSFERGERGLAEVAVARLITHEELTLPVYVVRGKRPGPRLLVSAAIHGDEYNGVEVIRQLLRVKLLKRMKGDLLAVPIVNTPGFVARSRYLPDRRDLNRLFPGSPRGSLGGRIARTLVNEVAVQCSHAIDLHTGAVDRPNLPQVRYCFADSLPEVEAMAKAFEASVVVDAPAREGSFRGYLQRQEIPNLIYEAGEASQLEANAVRFGLRGVTSVMRMLGMLPKVRGAESKRTRTIVCDGSFWVRAPSGGIFRSMTPLGKAVREGMRLGIIGDPLGEREIEVTAPENGVLIGLYNRGLVDEGDALFHIGTVRHREPERAERTIQSLDDAVREFDAETYHDDPEP